MDAELTQLAHDLMPFTVGLGLEIEEGGPERVVGGAEWAADRCTVGGALHGGYLMALADTVGALAAGQHLPPGAATATIDSATHFLRGVTEGRVTVTAVPVRVGRSTVVVQTDVTRADGEIAIRTIQTQIVLPPQS